jgi:signal transduction histidine kinase
MMRESAGVRAVRDLLAAHPRLVDALVVSVLTVLLFGLRLSEPLPGEPGRAAILMAALLAQTVSFLWHRSSPWLVLGVVSAGYLAAELAEIEPDLGNIVPIAIATYIVARRVPTPRSAVAIAAFPAVVVVTGYRDPAGGLDWFVALTVVAVSAGIWLIGVHQRRILADADRLLDLADRLRAEQERSARHAVAVERARIAHDLHDLVAHHISAIAMQARVSAEVVTEDPARAGAGLAGIGAAADTALTEMRRLLRLLADDRASRVADPEPSLQYLSRLTDGLVAAGFRISMTIAPAARNAPAAAQTTAYWVVREALTNVLRHAGPTDIVIDVGLDDGRLTATVDNGPPAADHLPTAGSGLGLVGMRERVRLYRGTLEAGPRPDGGWRVAADFQLAEVE